MDRPTCTFIHSLNHTYILLFKVIHGFVDTIRYDTIGEFNVDSKAEY